MTIYFYVYFNDIFFHIKKIMNKQCNKLKKININFILKIIIIIFKKNNFMIKIKIYINVVKKKID